MHYLRNKQLLIFAPLNTSSLLLLMGCVVIRNNSQTPIEFDADSILTDYTMLQTIFGGADYFCMKDYDELQTSLDVI